MSNFWWQVQDQDEQQAMQAEYNEWQRLLNQDKEYYEKWLGSLEIEHD